MMILGSDYDGTLTYGGITEEKCEMIRRWRQAGNKFGIISGRSAAFQSVVCQQYPHLEMDFFAACNGGVILDSDGNVLHQTLCNTVDALQLSRDLLKWGCPFVHMNTDIYRCIVASPGDEPEYAAQSSVVLIDNLHELGAFLQVSVQLADADKARAMVEQIRSVYGNDLNPLQNGKCIDIVPAGVNKAQGLYKVMEIFGGRYEDVIAVGDNINDLDMLREFRSYAMKNAPEEVKSVADCVTSGVDSLISIELERTA